jgi:hypothetical protein
VTWRRDWSGKLIAVLVVLGVLTLGGIVSGDAGSVLFGVVCGASAGALFYFRRPSEVAVTLRSVDGGTEVAVRGGPDAAKVERIVQTFVSPPAI